MKKYFYFFLFSVSCLSSNLFGAASCWYHVVRSGISNFHCQDLSKAQVDSIYTKRNIPQYQNQTKFTCQCSRGNTAFTCNEIDSHYLHQLITAVQYEVPGLTVGHQ